jgi:hypothetical protein
MEIQEQISRQRVKHIVDSYQLQSDDGETFDDYLEELMQIYPLPLIELAIAETLVDNWLNVPLVKGVSFLAQVHQRLKSWEASPSIVSTITPEQFQQITGLDPSPVFGVEFPPPQTTRPLA